MKKNVLVILGVVFFFIGLFLLASEPVQGGCFDTPFWFIFTKILGFGFIIAMVGCFGNINE